MATLNNPTYTVVLVDGTTKYNITPAVIEIDLAEQEKQMAQSANIKIMNVKVEDTWLHAIIKARQRVFIYADDGEKNDEVFRGWVWTIIRNTETDENAITIKCYDNLIYLQESEDSLYFSKGQKTSSVMQSICKKWNIALNYTYSSINHDQLVLRGSLSDIIKTKILDKTKERTGVKYVIQSSKDAMIVKPEGKNTDTYNFTEGDNVTSVRVQQTMDGMITQVVILGNAKKKSKKKPVLATVSGSTSTYGTLQKVSDKNDDTSLATAKKEAQNTINEKGAPFWTYVIKASDIPWIRKGDKIHLKAGGVDADLIVSSLDRTITNKAKTMTLTADPGR